MNFSLTPATRGFLVDMADAAVKGMAEHATKTLIAQKAQVPIPRTPPMPTSTERPRYQPSSGCPWCDVSDKMALARKNILALPRVSPAARQIFINIAREHLNDALGIIAVTSNIPQIQDLRTPILHSLSGIAGINIGTQEPILMHINLLNRIIDTCIDMSVTPHAEMPPHLDADWIITGNRSNFQPGATNGHDNQPLNANHGIRTDHEPSDRPIGV